MIEDSITQEFRERRQRRARSTALLPPFAESPTCKTEWQERAEDAERKARRAFCAAAIAVVLLLFLTVLR